MDTYPEFEDATVERLLPTHLDVGHLPGHLYDCPACESQCYCGNFGMLPSCCNLPAYDKNSCHTECVYCAIEDDYAADMEY